MTTRETQRPRRPSLGWGLGAGAVVGVLVYVPITIAFQHALEIAAPNATPRQLRARPVGIAPAYWATWAYAAFLVLAPAAVLAVFGRTRRVAAGYAVAAAVAGGLLAAVTIGIDIGGFAPT